MTTFQRFISKVNKSGPPQIGIGKCWNWIGSVDNQPGHGYGKFRFNGKIHVAHRISFLLHHGRIPKGKLILHICIGNRRCVNPKHLYPGTQKQNIQDQKKQNRFRRRNGEFVNTAKLKKCDVLKIFEMFKSGRSMASIAREFGIHGQTNIKKILLRISWKHVSIPENLLTFARQRCRSRIVAPE